MTYLQHLAQLFPWRWGCEVVLDQGPAITLHIILMQEEGGDVQMEGSLLTGDALDFLAGTEEGSKQAVAVGAPMGHLF